MPLSRTEALFAQVKYIRWYLCLTNILLRWPAQLLLPILLHGKSEIICRNLFGREILAKKN